MRRSIACAAVMLITAACAHADALFTGTDGVVVIESESSSSPLGKWVKKQSVEGHTGSGHLEFTGNNISTGPADSPLTYRFTVDRDGVYLLRLRAYKRLLGDDGSKARTDQCNDCYVRLEGDYAPGGEAPKAILGKDTKLYIHGKSAETWDYSDKLDYHHPETNKATKREPLYRLTAGNEYTLTISGRSQRYNLDRIVFRHESVTPEQAQDPARAESATRGR